MDTLIDTTHELLRVSLAAAVTLEIAYLRKLGGPTDYQLERARGFGFTLGERGDNLIYRSKKKGETAGLFARTAEHIAILAFMPGGVTFAGMHFEETGENNNGGNDDKTRP